VDAVNPFNACACDVCSAALSVVVLPYCVVVPYSTCVVDASFVVQLTVTPLVVMPEAATALITGGVVSSGVEVVKV
jgi:hypothetical protein